MKGQTTLRTRFLRLGLVIAMVKLVAVVTLVWASSELAQTTGQILDSRACSMAASGKLNALSNYRRHVLLHRLTGDSRYHEETEGYRRAFSEPVALAQCNSAVPHGAELISEIERRIADYLDFERGDSARMSTEERTSFEQEARRKFQAAHSALEEFVALNRQGADKASDAAEQVQAVTRQAGTVIGIGSILLVGGLLVMLQRRLVVPMHRLASAIKRTERTRNIGAPLGLGLEAELGEIERAVDDLSQTVAEQRSAQHQFVAAVAHDLRNPLQSIRGYCSLVRGDKPLPSEATLRKAFEVIDRQADKLARQLDDLLDAAHVESGALILNRREFELGEVLSDTRSMFDGISDKHRIEIEAAASLRIIGDPLRLGQVMTNLLSNAVKYSPNGGCVTVRVRRERGEALVSVRDEGIGIDGEQLARLFEPFRRGKRVRGLEIPGVGLGLSTSRRIVEAHGGRIEVESELGRGSTFTVRLPLLVGTPKPQELVRLPVALDREPSSTSMPPSH